MIYLSFYLRLIWGHAIVNLLSPVDVSLGRSASFDPVIAIESLLGLVVDVDSPPIKVY